MASKAHKMIDEALSLLFLRKIERRDNQDLCASQLATSRILTKMASGEISDSKEAAQTAKAINRLQEYLMNARKTHYGISTKAEPKYMHARSPINPQDPN